MRRTRWFGVALLIAAPAATATGVSSAEREPEAAWTKYANAMLARDLQTLRDQTGSCVRCLSCTNNTPEEQASTARLRDELGEKWIPHLYDKLIYVDRDVFLSEDLPVLLSQHMRTGLTEKHEIIPMSSDVNGEFILAVSQCVPADIRLSDPRMFEALVTSLKPSGSFEGAQGSFGFIETKAGYLLSSYETIP